MSNIDDLNRLIVSSSKLFNQLTEEFRTHVKNHNKHFSIVCNTAYSLLHSMASSIELVSEKPKSKGFSLRQVFYLSDSKLTQVQQDELYELLLSYYDDDDDIDVLYIGLDDVAENEDPILTLTWTYNGEEICTEEVDTEDASGDAAGITEPEEVSHSV